MESEVSAEIRRMFCLHCVNVLSLCCGFIMIIESLFIGNLGFESRKVCLIDLADFEVMRAERPACCETTGESARARNFQDFSPEASWQEKQA